MIKGILRKIIHAIPIHAFFRKLKHDVKMRRARKRRQHLIDLYEIVSDEIVLTFEEQSWLKQLKRDGFILLDGFFDKKLIEQIRNRLSEEIEDGRRLEKPGRSTYDHKYRQVLKDTLVHIPAVANLVFDHRILRLIAAYKRLIPVYYGRAYRTEPMPERLGSSYMHRDGYGDFTVIVFLHDITEMEGAGYYIRGTHGYGFRGNIPISQDERHVEDAYPKCDIVRYGGSAGTVLIADTTGYHKGPVWPVFGAQENGSRDVIHWVAIEPQDEISADASDVRLRIPASIYDSFDRLQRTFARPSRAEIIKG